MRDATVLAEYAQGLSVDWYPIKCTLRWDTYGIYAWELVSPFLMCLLPVLYIWASGPLHRFVDDKVAQIKYWARFTPEERAAALALREHGRVEAAKAKREHAVAMAIKYGIPPPVFDAAGNVVVAMPEQEEAVEGTEAAAAAAAAEGDASTGTEDGEGGAAEQNSMDTLRALVALGVLDDEELEEEHGEEGQVDADAGMDDGEGEAEHNSLDTLRALVALGVLDDETLGEEHAEEEEEEEEEGHVANEIADGNQTTPRRVVGNVVTLLEDEVAIQPQTEVLAQGRHGARRFDARYGFFKNISKHVLYVLEEPQGRYQNPVFGIRPGEVVRAEEVHDANIRIIGMWGSGWLSLYGADAKPQLVKLAASEVLLTADFAARDLPPAIYSREAVPGLENADSVDDAGHRFRAIEALCPQRGIGACVSFEMRCPCELLWARALLSPLSSLIYLLFFSAMSSNS